MALSEGSRVPVGTDRRPSSLRAHTPARAGPAPLNLQGEWACAPGGTRQAGSLLFVVLEAPLLQDPSKALLKKRAGHYNYRICTGDRREGKGTVEDRPGLP